jgi:hypothetical protein
MINALELRNCCELEPSAPSSRGGCCTRYEQAARGEVACWYDE